MAGKRVLLAAEFVRGGATLTRLLPLARTLASRGHDVSLAVPSEVARQTATTGFPLFDAPHWALPPPPGFVAISYADILMHGGYAAPDALRDLLTGWQAVLQHAEPDLLVADFAPTAMLAARITGTRMAAIGDGFSLPPLTAPLPGLRAWADVSPGAIDSLEGRILAVINARLGVAGIRPMRHLCDLFQDVPAFLCTFPELDHYPNRSGADCYGAVFAQSSGPEASWPIAEGQRIYIDLDPRHPALAALVQVLDRLALPTLIQGEAMEPPQARNLERPLVHITTTPNRAALFASSDIVVCQGLEVAAPALLAGKKLLMLPVFVEQMMTLHRVATQGFGQGIDPASDVAAIDAAVRRIVDDTSCRLHAANFARAYNGYQPATALDAVADDIDDLLTG